MVLGFKWAAIALLFGIWSDVRGELSCKDMNGKDVDWFIALKMPQLDKSLNSVHPDIGSGTAFFYADANNQDFVISKKNINDPQSALGYTVTQAIQAHTATKKDTMYMFYNDQQPCVDCEGEEDVEEKGHRSMPKKVGKWFQEKLRDVRGLFAPKMMKSGHGKDLINRAHAKGVMNFNSKQGFWLIHSSPRFSNPATGKYEFPMNARRNGQSFFCGTFLTDQLKEISIQIYHSQFAVYYKHLPLDMAKKFPRLYHVMMMDKTIANRAECPYFRNAAIQTKGGQWLQNYEKNVQADSDLWANQVTEHKKASFLVETWLNGLSRVKFKHQNISGPRDWKNSCDGKFFTKNIRSVKHPQGIGWVSSKDHSKWAVSDKPKTVCIGDINRQKSQKNRGGGCMCIDNEKIWKFFRDSVDVVECCEKEKGSCEAMGDDAIDVPERNRKHGDPAPSD